MRAYAKALMHPVSKGIVLVFFSGLTAFMAYVAIEKTTMGFDLVDLSPDSSYVRDYFRTQEDMFGSVTGKLQTLLYFQNHDYTDALVQAQMTEMQDELLDLEMVDTPSGVDSWHLLFTTWAIAQPEYSGSVVKQAYTCKHLTRCPQAYITGSLFYPALAVWLSQGDNKRFKQDVRFTKAKDTISYHIQSSRVTLYHVEMEDSELQVEGMVSTQKACGRSKLSPKPFVNSYPYSFFDQYRIIQGELYVNFLLCLIATTLICAVVIVHPLLCIMMTCVMLMIDVSCNLCSKLCSNLCGGRCAPAAVCFDDVRYAHDRCK